MKRITDKSFKYVPAASTDISKTFQRIRRELAEKKKELESKVAPLKARKA